jgi:hypothetical protein
MIIVTWPEVRLLPRKTGFTGFLAATTLYVVSGMVFLGIELTEKGMKG